MTTEPKGIIAIMTAPDGEVIATSTDFNTSSMGGCKLWESQMYRAVDAVKWRAVRAYGSAVMADALSNYLCQQIADALRSKGHKIVVREIGWGDDVAAELRLRR